MNYLRDGWRLRRMAAGILVLGMATVHAAEITARQAETAVTH